MQVEIRNCWGTTLAIVDHKARLRWSVSERHLSNLAMAQAKERQARRDWEEFWGLDQKSRLFPAMREF